MDTDLVRPWARHGFDGKLLDVIEIEGRPYWSARQVADALGYARSDAVSEQIRDEWGNEAEEETDYRVIRGEELAAAKALGLAESRAPSLMLLTESGVHLVTLLSRQPLAKRLRRWMAAEVLPALRRTGRYEAPGSVRALPGLAAAERLALSGEIEAARMQFARRLFDEGRDADMVLFILRSIRPDLGPAPDGDLDELMRFAGPAGFDRSWALEDAPQRNPAQDGAAWAALRHVAEFVNGNADRFRPVGGGDGEWCGAWQRGRGLRVGLVVSTRELARVLSEQGFLDRAMYEFWHARGWLWPTNGSYWPPRVIGGAKLGSQTRQAIRFQLPPLVRVGLRLPPGVEAPGDTWPRKLTSSE